MSKLSFKYGSTLMPRSVFLINDTLVPGLAAQCWRLPAGCRATVVRFLTSYPLEDGSHGPKRKIMER